MTTLPEPSVSVSDESQFRELADALPQLVWTARPDGAIEYLNQRARAFAAFEQRPDGTWIWARALHPDDREPTAAAWRRAIETGEPYEMEHRIQCADGHVRWYLSRAVAARDPHGRLLRWYGTTTDIDDRKAAEEALRDSEARYRAAVERQADGFWMTDLEGRVLEVNDAYLRMSGYTREEMLRLHATDVSLGESLASTRERIRRVVANGSHLFEATHRRKDGTHWLVEVDACYWPIGEGRIFVFLRDVNRRYRSEMLLRARLELSELAVRGDVQAMLRHALDTAELFTGSSIGFFHFVEEDRETLTLQTWSTNTLASACRAERTGAHYPVSKAGVWVECLAVRRAVIHNDYPSLPSRKGLPEGHAPIVRELVVPILQRGKIVAVLGVGNKATEYTAEDIEPVQVLGSITMDLVARVEAERKLRALYDRSIDEARTKSRLLTEINHRVKNNLLSLRGMMLVERRLLPPEAAGAVGPVLDRLNRRLQSLVAAHEILSASEWAPTDAASLATRLIANAVDAADARGRIAVQASGEGVRFSPRQTAALALVLNELATNSVKHAGDGARHLGVEARAGDAGIRLVYRDDGAGYPAAILEPGGVDRGGVGLRLIREIVEGTLRGRLELRNEGGAVATIVMKAEHPGQT